MSTVPFIAMWLSIKQIGILRSLGLALAIALAYATRVEARMYQWSHPATGTIQLSGSPPAWYRSASSGPRVFVFRDGYLVDDTAISVSEDRRLELRGRAFKQNESPSVAAQDREIPDPMAPPASPPNETITNVNATPDPSEIAGEEQATPKDAAPVETTVAELKALLDAWDDRRASEAKALLEETRAPNQ